MKFVKVFIPSTLYHDFNSKVIYGSVEHESESDSLKFFINSIKEPEFASGKHANIIGVINDGTTEFDNHETFITLSMNQQPAVTAVNDIRFKGESITSDNVGLFIYDASRFENLAKNESIFTSTADNDLIHLLKLIKSSKNKPNSGSSPTLRRLRLMLSSFFTVLSWIFSPFKSLFVQTAIYQHFNEWKKCLRIYSFKNYKSWTIVFDMVRLQTWESLEGF
jgi:hypothetical protein